MLNGTGVHDIPCPKPFLQGEPRSVQFSHLRAQHRQHGDGLIVFICQQLGQGAQGGVVLLLCDLIRHIEDHSLGNVICHRLHIGHSDTLTLCVSGYLVDLRDQPVHQIAADKDQALGRFQIDALPGRSETAGDPVDQHPLGLLRKLQFHGNLPQALDQLQSPVRLKLRGLYQGNGTIFGNVR